MTASAELPVLVVDDEFLDRIVAVELVEEAGLNPIEAGCAAEAVGILRRRRDVQIVMLDAGILGSVKGAELSELLSTASPSIFVLILGPSAACHDHIAANVTFVRKPLHGPSVVATLRRVADQFRAPW